MNKIGSLKRMVPVLLVLFWTVLLKAVAVEHHTIYNSPYVTFSPDRKAWTANAGDTNCVWYPQGTTVYTGIPSSLRELKPGEHYYVNSKERMVPVGKWVVTHEAAECIHHAYIDGYYHGINYGRNRCGRAYYSGWIAYCADCGGKIRDMLMYMSKDAAKSINYLDVRMDLDYYYLCPYCRNLEQGGFMGIHTCKAVSWNRYRVIYNVNTSDAYSGYMAASTHFYNNAKEYEGNSVTPVKFLSRNAYVRENYEFVEWNTKPDGSGTRYADGAEILNLTAAEGGTVTLYAQWEPVISALRTAPLQMEEGENVYLGRNNVWFVRSDGETPFALNYQAYLEGKAFLVYQPNYAIFESTANGMTAQNILFTPSHKIQAGEIRTTADGLTYSQRGNSLLGLYPYAMTIRSDKNRVLSAVQKFVLDAKLSGTQFRIIPVAGANSGGSIIYSEHARDAQNGITVIADGEPPVIKGMEILENRELINRGDGSLVLTVSAVDQLSGLDELYVSIVNTDNAIRKVYRPESDGSIQIELTKDEPIFSGDLVVTAHAVDHVGNSVEMTYAFTEFALETKVERILVPHDPIFKSGESGMLFISVWGYAERVEVEFPEEMTAHNPELNKTYTYTVPSYLEQESIQFMIPLETPLNQQYNITVRAYKGNKMLEQHPAVSIIQIEGTVLDEFRTRLR